MRSFYLIGIIAVLCVSCSTKQSNFMIRNTDDLETKIIGELEKDDMGTLVIWDVDEVLITPQSGLSAKYADATTKFPPITPEQRAWISYKLRFKQPMCLVDSGVVRIIKDLQKRNIRTMALTKCNVGVYESISLMDLRIAQLANVGIEFSPSFQGRNFIELSHIPKSGAYYPVFKAGILFCDHYEKGDVLGAFLDTVGWNPKKVIFIDDGEKHLLSVQNEMSKRGINFIGIHYTAIDDTRTNIEDNIYTIQYDSLVRDHIQLTDEQAANRLKKRRNFR